MFHRSTVAAFGLLGAGLASAQVLLQPVVLEMSPRQRTVVVSVTLSDKAAAPLRLQAQLLRWSQDTEGRSVTEPTEELLVSPPIADLQPGKRQVFRVAVRNARPLREEAAYRLVLEDIAEPPTDESGKPMPGVNIRMRYDMPVMLAATGKVTQALQWKPCAAPPPGPRMAEACVRVRNAGNRRIKVQEMQLAGDGWRQALAVKENATILAGAERELRVPLQGARGGAVKEVRLQTAHGENLQAEPGGF